MRKSRTGLVISDKMDKTVVVQVQTLKEHPKYHKVIRQSTRFKAHDEQKPVQGRRPRPDHGDAAALARQALARGRHRGESEITWFNRRRG